MTRLLYVDGCVHRNTSRTECLAQDFLSKRAAEGGIAIETVLLEDAGLEILSGERLDWRNDCIRRKDYTDSRFDLARQFAAAEELLIAVPYWDMSFPASLKLYLENICVNGLTFRYSEQGFPVGLTSIRRAAYITTAGGFIGNCDFGYEYVSGLLNGLFGIHPVQRISREGLDIKE